VVKADKSLELLGKHLWFVEGQSGGERKNRAASQQKQESRNVKAHDSKAPSALARWKDGGSGNVEEDVGYRRSPTKQEEGGATKMTRLLWVPEWAGRDFVIDGQGEVNLQETSQQNRKVQQ